ncbi:hypothetical protein Q9295_11555 [Xinfangfangia sp. CPCC 101601]|uniref:Uncharacterized protein n=1 Tax=Pseudogemmobacter lacusdianii TaxID=3069608 RepID=A0ABU0VZ39_9RHOB|nr:hypothetical protein [Xinfangfangia sp. CPCC 101601]MDQ2067014.1 hypothetical protein [Xinfangfangia sp. CPCC 101601]
MSEPLTSPEIEDVLSSIRRLVSEDLRPARTAMAEARAQDPAGDKLMLTPALRVVPRADADVAEVTAVADDWQIEAAEAASVSQESLWEETAAAAYADEAIAPSVDEAEAEGSETSFGATATAEIYDDAGMEGPSKLAAELLAQNADILWAAPGAPVDADEAERVAGPELSSFWQEPAIVAAVEAEEGALLPATLLSEGLALPMDMPEPVVAEAVPEAEAAWPEDSALASDVEIEELHASEPLSFVAHPRRGDRLHDPITEPLAQAWAEADLRADLDAGRLMAQTAVDAGAEADITPEEAHNAVPDGVAAINPAADGVELADDTGFSIDEETLRQIVREIIREELSGTLGERITRNVRKLVRVEVNRALTARDLE